MAVTLKQYGAQSATFYVAGSASGSLTGASFDGVPDGQLKTFVTTPFTDRAAMLEEWARIGGVYTVSGWTTENVILSMTSAGDEYLPSFGFSGFDVEAPGYVLRIQTRYSASE